MTTSAFTAVSGFIENTIIKHQPFTIPSSFEELAQTLVSKPIYNSSYILQKQTDYKLKRQWFSCGN